MAHHQRIAQLSLVAFLVGSGSLALADGPDEPGAILLVPVDAAQPPASGTAEVVEIQHAHPALTPAPVVLTALRPMVRPNRGPFFTLDAGLAWGGYAAIFAEDVSGPMATASVSMTFGGGRIKHGLRLGGYYGAMNGEVDHLFDSSEPAQSSIRGANLSYVMQVGGFFWSAGWGLINTRTRSSLGYDPGMPESDYSYDGDDLSDQTLPEGVLAVGYDLRFGRHLGLRLHGEVGTLLVTWRAQAAVGLVLRL